MKRVFKIQWYSDAYNKQCEYLTEPLHQGYALLEATRWARMTKHDAKVYKVFVRKEDRLVATLKPDGEVVMADRK